MPEGRGRSADRYRWLSGALQDSGVVLTASRRLARELRAGFNDIQLTSGASAWTTPAVLYWLDWARSVVTESATPESPRLISHTISVILWERCLRRHIDGDVMGLGSLTQHAMNAWQRLAQWQVTLQDVAEYSHTRDERIFLRSANDYQRALRRNNWLDPEQLVAAAMAAIQSGDHDPLAKIVLTGFDRRSPLVNSLLELLRGRGCEASVQSAREPSGSLTVQAMPDVEAELRAAGRWANAILAREPLARIAIVSSDLSSSASRYARLLREGLSPGWQTGSDRHQDSVNVSFGRRLSDYPAISAALLCLRWISTGLRSSEVSMVLRSPFLLADPAFEGAALDVQLRQLPDRLWTAAALADALADTRGESPAGGRLHIVTAIAALQVQSATAKTPSAWARHIHELLLDIGWPGDGVLQSDEFQLNNRWRELLNELAALDIVLQQVTLGEAIARLASLARDAVYQPETGPGMVSLLGSLEAAGMEFDHLWVIGVDSGRWPAQGNPLALVSRKLQREQAMPDATPVDTLEYSSRVLQRLAGSAVDACFSWARTESDAQQMPSPLLDSLGAGDAPASTDPGWYAETLIGKACVTPVTAEAVPGVQGSERLAGGSRVIALQWQEPFVAFAVGRLGIAELNAFQAGLTPRLRGNLLHDTLDELLRERPSQETQRGWSPSEKASRIDRSVTRAIRRYEQHADAVLRRLLALEKLRLREMLNDFLLAEAERSPFRIEQVEETLEFEHAGLNMTLRADRIDRLADDSLAIIDYKSGSPKKFLDRDGEPVEPQLVVYAAAIREPVGALVLVNISRQAIDYKGAGGEWRGIDEAVWTATLDSWKSRVRATLEDIARGDVRINLYPGSGTHRQLDVLSRVEEERRAR